MRISETMMGQSLLNNLNRNKFNIEELKTKIAMNTRIRKPSDAPLGAARVLQLTDSLDGIETYLKNNDNGISFLEDTTFHLESMQTEIEKVMTKLTDLSNGTLQDSLPDFGQQIDLAIKSLLDLANSKSDGKYLFGGTDFSEKPYGFTTDMTAVELKVGDVSGVQKIQISKHNTQKVNMTGQEIFGDIDGSDIFNTLISIRDKLNNSEMPTEAELTAVSDFNDKLINKLSEAGNITNRLYDNKELLNNQKLAVTDLISKEKDIDMAQAIMELQSQEYMLQLSYKLSSSIMPKSLLDFI